MEHGETYFRIYRNIFSNGLWNNPLELRLFIWILGNAVYDEKGANYGSVKVNRGQYLRSYRKLQEDLTIVERKQIKSYSLSTIKKAIDKLVEIKNISLCETEYGTLFTVLDYDKFHVKQSKNKTFTKKGDNKNNEHRTGHQTVSEQLPNNNNKVYKEKEYSLNSEEFRLSSLLYELIKQRNPNHKEPDLQKWSVQIDLMMRVDKRNLQEIEDIIRWSQENEFWQNNILSTSKLRKQYDTLYLQMNSSRVKANSQIRSTTWNLDI